MSEYETNAKRVANELGLKVSIKRAKTQTDPKWTGPHGTKYRVSLKLGKKSTSFDFWGSQHDKEKGKDPGVYDILACVSSDMSMPTDPDEIHEEFGANMKPSQCKAVANHAKKLQAFFSGLSESELDKLREIS